MKKTREILIRENKGAFEIFRPKLIPKKDYDFTGISALRRLLSNERARMIEVIKNQKPKSIYELSRKLNRDFKAVFEDIKLLKKFGLIDLVKEKEKNRIRQKPIIISDNLTIQINF